MGRNAGDLGQTCFDSIDERVVRHNPVEGAGTRLGEKYRGGGHVSDVLKQALFLDPSDTLEPQCFLLYFLRIRVSAVTMVCFVIYDEDMALLRLTVRNSVDYVGRRLIPAL